MMSSKWEGVCAICSVLYFYNRLETAREDTLSENYLTHQMYLQSRETNNDVTV